MEFTEMEKRMLYQTEGSERYAVLQEMSMASRYAGDPARRKAAKSLLEKLRPLTDAECMEAVHDIRRNYRLPQEGRTIGELLAQARQRSGAEHLKGMTSWDWNASTRRCSTWLYLMCFQVIPPWATKGTGCACSLRTPGMRDSRIGRKRENSGYRTMRRLHQVAICTMTAGTVSCRQEGKKGGFCYGCIPGRKNKRLHGHVQPSPAQCEALPESERPAVPHAV